VKWEESASGRRSRLNGVLIDVYAPEESAGYPTLCKGRFEVGGNVYYAMEEPTSLNVLDILPDLYRAGVAAIKVEGRQRSPAYVAQVTRTLREAIDACAAAPETFLSAPRWIEQLDKVAEGHCHTLGAYSRPWQ
jgi:putative protease